MSYLIYTILPPDADRQLELPNQQVPYTYANKDNSLSPCQLYSHGLDISREFDRDLIIYIHNDVTIHDPNWLESVMITLEQNPKCIAVGLGGATQLGNKDLYRKPYIINNMARYGFSSNLTDAEVHGDRFSGVRRVAVLDAFFMAVRRSFLTDVGGWPTRFLTHHCLDLWLACEAARQGKEIWMTGVSCTHHGGGASTKPSYGEAKWLQGGTLEKDHQLPHRYLWDNYRDILPIVVEETA